MWLRVLQFKILILIISLLHIVIHNRMHTVQSILLSHIFCIHQSEIVFQHLSALVSRFVNIH
jgi:hypothetical protein